MMILTLAAYAALFALLLATAVVDIRERLIPNALVASIVGVWLAWRIAAAACAVASGAGLAPVVADTLAGVVAAAVVGGGLLVMTAVYERVRGIYAFGGGDVKLLAAMALFLGVVPMLFALCAACAVSLLYAVLARRTTAENGIPFAPCAACGFPMALMLVL